MKILILGGDGFIGSYLVEELLAQGHDVSVFGRFPFGTSKFLPEDNKKLKLIQGDFNNREDIQNAILGHEIIYHLISASNPKTSWNDPLIEVDLNIKGSLRVFELACQSGTVKKISYSSSGGAVYGYNHGVINENNLPLPFNPYGISKLTIEHFLNYYQSMYNVQADIFRIGNAIGPRQPFNNSQGVLAVWIRRVIKGEPIVVFGNNEIIRDYIHVKDVAKFMSYSAIDISSSGVYNLGSSKGIGLLDLLTIFQDVIPRKMEIVMQPKRPSDNDCVILDSSKIQAKFPKHELIELRQTILEMWDYMTNENLK